MQEAGIKINIIHFLFLIPLLILPLNAYADFPLDTLNTDPQGITYDTENDRFAVLDINADKVFMYAFDGTRLPNSDFVIDLNGTTSIGFLTTNIGFNYVFQTNSSDLVHAFSLTGIREQVSDFETNESTGNIGFASGLNSFYILNSNLQTIQSYDRISKEYQPDNSFSVTTSDILSVNDLIRVVDDFYILASPYNQIYSFDSTGEYQPQYNINTQSVFPNYGMTYYDDFLYVVGSGFVKEFTLTDTLQDITTLTANSNSPFKINLEWITPISYPPVTGYQINFSSPFSQSPQIILINDTNNPAPSTTISSLSVGAEYSFRIAPYNISGKGGVSNVVNATTLEQLQIGSFDLDEPNPNKAELLFSLSENGDDTNVIVSYNKNWNLKCMYDTKFGVTNQSIPIQIIPLDSTRNQAQMIFTNASNDIITITCTDELTQQSGNYLIAQFDFPLKEQLQNFRSGTYGTYGLIGALDLITVAILLLSMIAFNSTNESVGLIGTIAVIGIALYFEFITYPAVLLPLVAFIIMLVFATTKKA